MKDVFDWGYEVPVDIPRDAFVDASFHSSTHKSHRDWWLQKFIQAYAERGGFLAAGFARVFVWRQRAVLYEQMLHRDPQIVAVEKLEPKRQD